MGNGTHGHNLGHTGNGKYGQRGIMVNTADRDGAPLRMGHMGDGAHVQHMANGAPLRMGQMDITSLILEGSSPKSNSTWILMYSI